MQCNIVEGGRRQEGEKNCKRLNHEYCCLSTERSRSFLKYHNHRSRQAEHSQYFHLIAFRFVREECRAVLYHPQQAPAPPFQSDIITVCSTTTHANDSGTTVNRLLFLIELYEPAEVSTATAAVSPGQRKHTVKLNCTRIHTMCL